MISKTYLRYIWLLDTLYYHIKGYTFEQIEALWKQSPYAYMGGLPIRTFHEHRKAIDEMFGVKIECDKSKGFTYRITNRAVVKNNPFAELLLRRYSVPQGFITFQMMSDRIVLEEIPSGKKSVDYVMESMRCNTELVIDYQRYDAHQETVTILPYALRVYNRRWYILGYIKEKEEIRHLALDRILTLKMTNKKFEMPADFDARKYYKNVVGIYVDDTLPVVNLKLKVYGVQVEYLRSLPLHKSQEEVRTRYGEFSEFSYKVCLTPELKTQILSMGSSVEVLEPVEFREEIKKEISASLERYL